MLEDIATPQEQSETPTTSMPPGSHQILAVCSSLALGCTHGCWAVYTGIQLEMEVLGPIRWCWVVHAGIGLYMWVLGCTCWRLA